MPVMILGVGGAALGVRQEIRTFLQNRDLRNMFILGLRRMQLKPMGNPESWFQICGIYGRPFTVWDGQVDLPPIYRPDSTSDLRPAWNRIYLALFEQVLHDNVREVVETFPAGDGTLRERYDILLPTFRVPYLDLALDSDLPKAVFGEQNIQVTLPSGAKELIPNPLFSYYFGAINPDHFPGDEARANTVRWPESPDPVWTVNSKLGKYTTIAAKSVLELFNIDVFSDLGKDRLPASLESIHESGSLAIGGSGNLSDSNVAAFDPVFWLHLCNADRLFTLWQAVYPAVAPPANETPLRPFRNLAEAIYRSDEVLDHTVFNSTYPELSQLDLDDVPPAHRPATVLEMVRNMYRGDELPARPPYKYRVSVRPGAALGQTYIVMLSIGNAYSLGSACLNAGDAGEGAINPEDSIPLNHALSKHITGVVGPLNLQNLQVEPVRNFLRNNLNLDVRYADGTLVAAAAAMPNLRIEILYAQVPAVVGEPLNYTVLFNLMDLEE